MAQPSPYNRAFNFSAFQAANPTAPLPANQLDTELSRVKVVTDQIRAALARIQRDDLALANASVGADQLKSEVQIGVNPPRTWATATNYIARDTVFYQNKFYIAEASHVSTTFSADFAAGRWGLVADFTAVLAANLVVYDNSASGIAADNLQEAVDAIAGSINVSSVFGRAGAVVAADGDYTASQVVFSPSGRVNTSATRVQQAINDIDTALATAQGRVVPAGAIMDYAGTTAPTGWLLCFGQAVSRTTYAALFTAIGTTYGTGDGATTFNLPDLRGRVTAGQDNMGGTSANRLTGLSGGLDGDFLGSTGGSETHTLTTAQLPVVTPAGAVSAPTITITGGTIAGNTNTTAEALAGPAVPSGTLAITATASAPVFTGTPFGSGAAHNNVQPTLILNKIIKT